MGRRATGDTFDARLVLTGVYFIAVGGVVSSRAVIGVLRDLRDVGAPENLALSLVGAAVGTSLIWIAKMLLSGSAHAYWVGIYGALAALGVTLVVAIPIVTDGLAGLLFGGFLISLPIVSSGLIYSARGEFKR